MFRPRSATAPLLPATTSNPAPSPHLHLNTGSVSDGNAPHNYETFSKAKSKPIIAIRPIEAGQASRPGHISIWRVILAFFLVVIPLLLLADLDLPDIPWPGSPTHKRDLCPQQDALYPVVHAKLAEKITHVYESPEFFGNAVASLSGAVKIAYVIISWSYSKPASVSRIILSYFEC
jgi:hypothetical protein